MGSEKLFAPAADKGTCVPGLLASRKGQDTFLKSVAAPKLGCLGFQVQSLRQELGAVIY